MVEMKVANKSNIYLCSWKYGSSIGCRNFSSIKIEYITKAVLLPTSVVLINLEGVFTKGDNIFAEKLPCLFLSSILNLFAEINAISIPEKKAQAMRVKNMIIGPSKI